MADYLNKYEYHAEMVMSKQQNKLTDKAITMFMLHARETSKLFYFECQEDREDAISAATLDFLKYWKGFKENNVVQFKLIRELEDGETFIFKIKNYKEFQYVARENPKKDNEFLTIIPNDRNNKNQVKTAINKTLQNLHDLVKRDHELKMDVSLHKVTGKIAFVDTVNKADHSIISSIQLKLNGKLLILDEKIYEEDKTYEFKKPPYSFNHITSLIRNAIIKFFDENNPKETRNGKKIRFSQFNTESQGAHGIE
jgi:hypothetical protein